MEKVKCNNCANIYEDEVGYEYEKGKLILMNDNGEHYKGCPICKTDAYLTDVENE